MKHLLMAVLLIFGLAFGQGMWDDVDFSWADDHGTLTNTVAANLSLVIQTSEELSEHRLYWELRPLGADIESVMASINGDAIGEILGYETSSFTSGDSRYFTTVKETAWTVDGNDYVKSVTISDGRRLNGEIDFALTWVFEFRVLENGTILLETVSIPIDNELE